MRATNLMYRCPKEQTPDAYYTPVLNDGKSIDYNRKENFQKSFSSGPRFLLYKQMASRTGPCVGPGSYGIQEAVKKLKQKPCMVKLSQTQLADEECYEIVNNIRVLQPKYLRSKDRKVFEKNIENYRKNKLLRRINETFVHQRSIIEFDRPQSQLSRSNIKSRNNLYDTFKTISNNANNNNSNYNNTFLPGHSSTSVDFHVLERPKTQQGFSRKKRNNFMNNTSNYQTLNPAEGNNNQMHFGQLDEPLVVQNNQKTIDVQSMQNVKKHYSRNGGQSSHQHTHSLIDRNTLLNGSTNASFDYNLNQNANQQSFVSGLTSLKGKSKQNSTSEFGLRIRNKSNQGGQATRINIAYGMTQGKKSNVDKNKKYIKQIINNNCFVDNQQTTMKGQIKNFNSNYNDANNQPSLDGIEVNLNQMNIQRQK